METERECPSNPDGVCTMHYLTEERRSSDRNRLADLKAEFNTHKEKSSMAISNLCTFKNRVLGASVLGLLVVTGGYVYTNSHEVSANARFSSIDKKIESIDSRVQENRIDMAVVVSKIDTTNQRLKELIDALQQDRKDAYTLNQEMN